MSQVDCWIISKFIHEWLSLLDQYHIQSNSLSKQCPSCQGSTKTVSHFVNCLNPEHQQIWNNLHELLYKLHLKQNAPPQYYNALTHGLYIGQGAEPSAPLHEDDAMIQTIQQQQEQLGWKQLYYGWLTNAWVQSLNARGIVFYSRVLLLIWQSVLALWKLHN